MISRGISSLIYKAVYRLDRYIFAEDNFASSFTVYLVIRRALSNVKLIRFRVSGFRPLVLFIVIINIKSSSEGGFTVYD